MLRRASPRVLEPRRVPQHPATEHVAQRRHDERRRKVACETIAFDVDVANAHEESRRTIWAWPGLTGATLERDGSTKGSSNPKTTAEKATRNKGGSRAPRRLEAIVVGVLPAEKMVVQQRRSPVVGRRCAGVRVFASEAVGTELASPKVSCFGAVRYEIRAAAPAPAALPHRRLSLRRGQGLRERGTEPASPKVSCFGAVRSEIRAAAPAPAARSRSRAGAGRASL
ncbi:hypothetical protein D1007_48109 [Hordeum vulgare]|nr:hypothetical protein D1007_48109 [Hordeum vulgare]